jgi:hypothetical protein
MKKILYNCIYGLMFCSIASSFLFLTSCEDDEKVGRPVVTEVRNYEASPDDTLVQSVQVGQWVVVMGKNLSKVSQVLFGGIPASLNTNLFTDESIIVQVPYIRFDSVPPSKVHEITLVNHGGVTTFGIEILGPPLLLRVRNFADAPNDTIVNSVAPGQYINIIGFNLKDAESINFQGVDADLTEVVYTDSSTIVKVPEDFTDGDAALANKITYTTAVDASTFFIPIFDPAVLEYYKDPLWVSLTGGIGNEKIWTVDFNAQGTSQKFAGPMWFSGDQLRWNFGCAVDGGNCWNWAPEWQSWMPSPKDYGTMTFRIKGVPVLPTVTVNQKGLDAAKNGIFSGSYFLDTDEKTITFTDVTPLYMGWENVDWSKAYIITLTDDGMQLGFKHKSKAELELYNYIPK